MLLDCLKCQSYIYSEKCYWLHLLTIASNKIVRIHHTGEEIIIMFNRENATNMLQLINVWPYFHKYIRSITIFDIISHEIFKIHVYLSNLPDMNWNNKTLTFCSFTVILDTTQQRYKHTIHYQLF